MKTTHQALWISFVLVAMLSLAPPASPSTAAAYDASAFVAPNEEALVVFIHNLRDDERAEYVVFDPEKTCVASVGGRQAEVVPMKPGRYTLYVAGYNTVRIELDLDAGRTYFVRIHSVDRFATRVSDVTPARRGTDSYKEIKTWLSGAQVALGSDDPCRGKPLDKKLRRVQKGIHEANADWKAGDDAYRAKYTMHKEDGLTPTEVSRL
ncbi:MAG: hypothetical protein OEV36_10965 [Myxococcales bacterium]|nr:hypothetical protein [Myxococcales bacterium]